MADMSQYYDALRNADAAGDHAAAQKIADYIHSQESRQPSAQSTESSGRSSTDYAKFAAGNLLKGAVSAVEPIAEKGQQLLDLPAKAINALATEFGGNRAAKNNVSAPELGKATPISDSGAQAILQKAAPGLMDASIPKTTSEQYAAAALQALPASIGGEGSLLRRGAQAALSGIGAKVGGDIAGPAGAVVGGILGGGAAAEKGLDKASTSAQLESQRSGIPLTIGQETGSKALIATENIIGKSVLGQGTSYADRVHQTAAGVQAVSKLADRMSAEPQNAEDIGRKLQTALTDTVSKYDQLRSQDAARDYGVVKQLAQDRPVIKYNNTVDALNKIIDENRNVPSGESKKIYAQALSMRDDLVLGNSPRTFTIDDAMRTRRTWGAAARGTGNVFTDVDPNLSRQFAARLFGAIQKDFEGASTENTPIAQALAKANKRYSDYSRSIDYVRKSALGSLVGPEVADAAFTGHVGSVKAPELMAHRFMALQPSQARQVTNILRRNSPQVLEDTKAYMLRDMLDKAKNNAPGEPPMSFDRFLTQYKKISPKLKEMGFTEKDLAEIKDITNTMARASDKSGANPSGTAQALQFAALAAHPVFIVPNYVAAKALLTPQGRALLKRAYSGATQAVRYQAHRALMGAYLAERGQKQQTTDTQ